MNYEIGFNDGWQSYAYQNKITLQNNANTIDISQLTDDQVTEYISDVLLHEHMHMVLFDLFDSFTICAMFDIIERHFRNMPLFKSLVPPGIMTHTEKVELYGCKGKCD